jgi:hypothetical protein
VVHNGCQVVVGEPAGDRGQTQRVVEPQEVQRLLRHKTRRITLETYVHWWPKRDRRWGIIGDILGATQRQDQSKLGLSLGYAITAAPKFAAYRP